MFFSSRYEKVYLNYSVFHPLIFFAAISEKECELWLQGLKYLTADTISSPYPLQVERWLRKEFYALENTKDT